MIIKLLEDSVINQIAAGEVVERPASVVRELVDNAIDAGSKSVSVFLEEGGKHLIRVLDTGCGMSKDDARLACERHATSKIHTTEDLNQLHTLGFRGEALSSIAAVTRLKITTRSKDEELGTEIVIDGGELRYAKSVAAPVGTDIRAANLFFNVPARKKFLKQPATEEQKVKQWLIQSSIAHPDIHYKLTLDGEQSINFPPAYDMISRAKSIFKGTSVTFNEEIGPLKICGLLCHPAMAQADTKAMIVFVNKRLVSDKIVSKAIREGFSSTLKDSEYPLGFVSIELPPSEVDVNVHPQKSEVRFRSGGDVFATVREIVRRSVQNFNGPVAIKDKPVYVGPITSQTPIYSQNPINFRNKIMEGTQQYTPSNIIDGDSDTFASSSLNTTNSSVQAQNFEQPNLFQQTINSENSKQPFLFSNLKYIGQVLSCFLLCEYQESLYVIDMHAAHERCNYNKIRKNFENKCVESQLLLVPQSIELTEIGVEQCLNRKEMLENFGFEIERFGTNVLLIRAVPVLLSDVNLTPIIKEIAALEDEMDLGIIDRTIDFIAARIACHASIRSGDIITREETYALFADLDQEDFNSACPHGRPIITSFSRSEIEKWFGRDK